MASVHNAFAALRFVFFAFIICRYHHDLVVDKKQNVHVFFYHVGDTAFRTVDQF